MSLLPSQHCRYPFIHLGGEEYLWLSALPRPHAPTKCKYFMAKFNIVFGKLQKNFFSLPIKQKIFGFTLPEIFVKFIFDLV